VADDEKHHLLGQGDELPAKVLSWMNSEGYPLEFKTARAFRDAGFWVRQGDYTTPVDGGPPREMDVVANLDGSRDGASLLRISHVIECKWSADKPWILFKAGSGISTAACVSQSIGSELGEAILWKEAGATAMTSLSMFETPAPASFGGRQAFSGTRDLVFDALRSVTFAASTEAHGYDRGPRRGEPPGFPRAGVVVFPVVVIQGRLFEALEDRSGEMTVHEVEASRVHWRGVPNVSPHATIDVVTSDAVQAFAAQRAADSKRLLRHMEIASNELRECFAKRSLDDLRVERASRGVIGLPPLLYRLAQSIQAEQDQRALPHSGSGGSKEAGSSEGS
jgi:hypothetical protein